MNDIEQIASSQSQKEIVVNESFRAMRHAALFGVDADATAALTWGYYGGQYRKADGTITDVADSTIALTASATNYILETDGVVSKVTSAPTGWPGPLASSAKALYQVSTSSTAVTSSTDYRTQGIGSGAGSGSGTVTSVAMTVPAEFSVSGSPVTSSGTLAVSKATQSANTVWAGPTSGSAAAPAFRALVAADLPTQPFDVVAFYPGVPTASAKVYRAKFARAVTFAANFSGSQFAASANATGSTVFDIQKNGSSCGTCTIGAGGTTPTFASSGGAAVSFAVGDLLAIIAPGTADATLADPSFTLAGTR